MSEPHELEERAVKAMQEAMGSYAVGPVLTLVAAKAVLALVRQEQEKAPDEAMVKAALKACGFDEAKSSLKFFEDAGIIKVRGIKWTGDVEYAAMIRAWWLSHTAKETSNG